MKSIHSILLAALFLLPSVTAGESEPVTQPGGGCWPGPPGSDPALCPPNDPVYPGRWEFLSTIPDWVDRSKMHPAEAALGAIGFSVDAAWQQTIGRDDVLIAVLDSGIRWNYPDLVNKLYLNAGELPIPEGATAHDANGDGRFDIRDYATDTRVGDRNGNGHVDPQDLITVFSDCVDDDGNGYPDDISGYDFFAGSHCGSEGGDNDPGDQTDFGHGTGIASTAAGETNNGYKDSGVCPECRVLPVRVGDSFVVDANQFARGVVFAVRSGADVIGAALGSYNNTPAARFAVDMAYDNDVTIVASAADEFSYHHNYPSVYNHTIYVNAIRFNHSHDETKATTFWGLNPCTNFGARVWITVPAESCSSGATSRLSGTVGLIASAARDAGIDDLRAGEVFQLLRTTADDLDNSVPDWGGARYPARAGFDEIYGYGRLNALRAVQAVAHGEIPPIVDLGNPRWFAVISPAKTPRLPVYGTIELPRAKSAEYLLAIAPGVQPLESEYKRIAGGRVEGHRSGMLGMVQFDKLKLPTGPPPRNRAERDAYSMTLRLSVTDDAGRVGEARRSFFLLDDPSWVKHFPRDLRASGEAAPVLVDLDDDGRDEIVLPTADGSLRIYAWSETRLHEKRIALNQGPPIDPLGPPAFNLGRDTVMRAAAVGDLQGKGTPSIVVASRSGTIYAFSPRGERLAGFPVALPRDPDGPATKERVLETGIFTRPVLANLDGKPGLEIVIAALDGRLHVWRHDGRPLPGFPVTLRHPLTGQLAKIISTPAIGDLDGDGRPEIVVGSNGVRENLGAAYAVYADGTLHPDGPYLPGWPLELPGLRPDLLPTLARGVQMDPALADADGDGDMEVLLYAVTGDRLIVADQPKEGAVRTHSVYAMTPDPASGYSEVTFLSGTGSPLIADTDGNGRPEIYAPLLSMRMLTLRSKPGIPLEVPVALGGWEIPEQPVSGERVPMLPGWPRRMEDLMLMARPIAADLDGDGEQEVLMGSGGYLLHGFKRDGEAAGFPKFTGGWTFTAPAVGDIDGDGNLELVSVTREGYLFAWKL